MSAVQTYDASVGDVQRAAIKSAGFERCDPAVITVAIEMARRYKLELPLRHLIPIEGKPFITRDGLLHVAHMSGQLDGIVLEEEGETGPGAWWAVVAVYRKDMSHPFKYRGRYSGPNKKFGPEMAVKCAEAMCLRRAFDVSIASEDEFVFGGDHAPSPPPRPPQEYMDADKASRLRAIVAANKIPGEVVKALVMSATGGRVVEKGAANVPLYSQDEYQTLVASLKSWKAPAESQAPQAENPDAEVDHAG